MSGFGAVALGLSACGSRPKSLQEELQGFDVRKAVVMAAAGVPLRTIEGVQRRLDHAIAVTNRSGARPRVVLNIRITDVRKGLGTRRGRAEPIWPSPSVRLIPARPSARSFPGLQLHARSGIGRRCHGRGHRLAHPLHVHAGRPADCRAGGCDAAAVHPDGRRGCRSSTAGGPRLRGPQDRRGCRSGAQFQDRDRTRDGRQGPRRTGAQGNQGARKHR